MFSSIIYWTLVRLQTCCNDLRYHTTHTHTPQRSPPFGTFIFIQLLKASKYLIFITLNIKLHYAIYSRGRIIRIATFKFPVSQPALIYWASPSRHQVTQSYLVTQIGSVREMERRKLDERGRVVRVSVMFAHSWAKCLLPSISVRLFPAHWQETSWWQGCIFVCYSAPLHTNPLICTICWVIGHVSEKHGANGTNPNGQETGRQTRGCGHSYKRLFICECATAVLTAPNFIGVAVMPVAMDTNQQIKVVSLLVITTTTFKGSYS